MMAAGINHIVYPRFYKTFIPKWLPLLTVNYLFGLLELIIGVMLLVPAYRREAAIALFLLMLFFLPFHLLDVFKDKPMIGSKLLAYIRLPLQFVLIWLAWVLVQEFGMG